MKFEAVSIYFLSDVFGLLSCKNFATMVIKKTWLWSGTYKNLYKCYQNVTNITYYYYYYYYMER